jgi:protoporphyrinogen oxidase
MKVIVIGGGIAGLAAAWTLRKHGAEVTILEKNEDAGGRCRAFLWHGLYLDRGAGVFIDAEENLIEQAQQLGIYDTIPRIDVLEKRPRFHVLYKKREIVSVDDFDLYAALKTKMVPLTEKLALGRVLPQVFRQLAHSVGN